MVNKQNGPVNFYPNPNVQGANVLTNGGTSNYHALQLEVTRRTRHGLQGQFSYTFGKSLSNTAGDWQTGPGAAARQQQSAIWNGRVRPTICAMSSRPTTITNCRTARASSGAATRS